MEPISLFYRQLVVGKSSTPTKLILTRSFFFTFERVTVDAFL
jgi:hypothetical protein